MELTELPLPPEIWAATPGAAEVLIMGLQARDRELEAPLGQSSRIPPVPHRQIHPKHRRGRKRRLQDARGVASQDTVGPSAGCCQSRKWMRQGR